MSSIIYGLSRWLAWFGGFVLAVLALLSVVSICGRALSGYGFGPVPGDFELVEAGAGLVVFSFMPWCHLRYAHATVDLLWGTYPRWLQRALTVFVDAMMLAVWILLVWRMGVATQEYHGFGEVSFILQMPVWWGYAASMVPAVIGCVVYAWRLAESLNLVAPPAGVASTVGAMH
ncbi:MAG: TRAP transporter small permease [Rubrivivax sp.]|nr:TRAP transporter small permease [Rubrivivax sp.]